MEVIAGVPQGSPISPILFLLYIASLYQELLKLPGLLVVRFADDTNIIVFSPDPKKNHESLSQAWHTYSTWAKIRGMEFAPQKSELMHFTRAHIPCTELVQLKDAVIEPSTSARFLGVWLDRKPRWKAHLRKIREKMAT